MFSTSGIRGDLKKMSPEFCVELGKTFGTFNEGEDILVGCDTRTSSAMLKTAVISGLLATGKNVFDTGMVPTPAISYITKKHYDGGVIITGSHIAPHRNGIKFFKDDGEELLVADMEVFERIFNSKGYRWCDWKDFGVFENVDEGLLYRDFLLSKGKENDLTIVLDMGHGAQCGFMPRVLENLGYTVIPINENPNGLFPGRGPEPKKSTLGGLVKKVRNTNADLGIAYDGDGDRSAFVTKEGFVYGDYVGALFSKYFFKKGPVVTPLNTSLVIDHAAKKYGGRVIRCKIGAPHLIKHIKEYKASFGFEDNCSYVFPKENLTRDGGLATIKMLNLISDTGTPLNELLKEFPVFPLIKYEKEVPEGALEPVYKTLEGRALNESKNVTKVDRRDGIKLIYENGWVLIRKSGNEPIIRLFVEFETEEDAKKHFRLWKDRINRLNIKNSITNM